MWRNSLWLLALVVAGLALAYFWLPPRPLPPGVPEPVALLPALQGQVASVSAIEVRRAGQPLVRLERRDDTWVVPAKAAYPAALAPITRLLRALVEAHRLEAQTANAQLHGRLGLAEQGDVAQQATRISLELPGARLLALRVGQRSQQGMGQWVRLAGEDQVWLIDRVLELPATELEWLDRRITAIPFASIKALELRYANGERLTVWRDNQKQANLQVKQLPPGKRLVDEAVANSMAGLFAQLDFADAAPLAQVQFKSRPLLQFRLTNFSDGRLDGAVYAQGEQRWLTLPQRHNFSAEELPGKADWAYRLEPAHYQTLAKKLKDMLPGS